MKEIKIETLDILNFKGTQKLVIDFGDVTNIYGSHAAGKTTIADAFSWLLFGRNSRGIYDSNIMTLSASGEIIPDLEHSVSATLLINGLRKTLRKTITQDWKKKHYSDTRIFVGNNTQYFIDGVPLRQKDYQSFIDSLVTSNNSYSSHLTLPACFTNPLYFNEMHWTEQREVLQLMLGSTIDPLTAADAEVQLSKMFSLVRFKLLKEQVNGGIKETCIITINGIPYSSLNRTMKANAGLDIIKTLSNHFSISAPIFIENIDELTKTININTQIINLIFSEDDEIIRIEQKNRTPRATQSAEVLFRENQADA